MTGTISLAGCLDATDFLSWSRLPCQLQNENENRAWFEGPTTGIQSMLRARQKLGKYRIEKRIAQGGFAVVYRSLDTIEGIRVALKIPHSRLLTAETLEVFRHEARLVAQLDHPNILPIKNAELIEGHFVIACSLGEQSLADRIRRRLSLAVALDLTEQLIDALAYAHKHRIIHCDVNPDNIILFPGNRLRLSDFGIAKVALRTVKAAGSGTVGYIAPEQAMGRPSFRSDVFSAGLVAHRMLTGRLPEWPFHWPYPGWEKLRARAHPKLIEFLRRATNPDPQKRFRDADQMLTMFRKLKSQAVRYAALKGRRNRSGSARRDWKEVRRQQFQRDFGRQLQTRFACGKCGGPVSEAMFACPWCGQERAVHRGQTQFPAQCPRCRRGMKLDWSYCPWCYGPGFEPHTTRSYTDVRYQARCTSPRCRRKLLMPFMRYCPWCHAKVRRRWLISGHTDKCSCCGWGILPSYWQYCPWCGKLQRGQHA